MQVEIWSDVVCPWCYVGKRRFEAALRAFPHAGDEVQAVLDSDRFAADVRDDEQRAIALGITAVPFFLFDSRYGVAGAQSPAVLGRALQEVLDLTAPARLATTDEATPSCEGDACAVPTP